jgi:hypothetical protein
MPVGNLPERVETKPFPEFHHPLLMAGGTEMTALTGEGQKVFMLAIPSALAGAWPDLPTAEEIREKVGQGKRRRPHKSTGL